MDQAFVDLVGGGNGQMAVPRKQRLQLVVKDASGEVEVETPGGPKVHRLKPLTELYGHGIGAGAVDPANHQYMPLFLAIETSIVERYRSEPDLTDAKVLLALEKLGLNPECDPADDALVQRLQTDLRLVLSLEDYSRQDVRGALRKVAKSVARHTRSGGPWAYLSFIDRQFSA